MEEKNYLEIKIEKKDDGLMIKSFLRENLQFSARRVASVKFAEDGILLNGEKVNVRAKLQEGDTLKVLLQDSEKREQKLIPYDFPLDVLYEDENLIVVNKPAGLVTHPSRGHLYDTLLNAIRFYLDEKGDSSLLHLVGRLDKDTSGALLVCKNSVSADRLSEEKKNGTFYKEYLALAAGVFEKSEGEISIPMQGYHDETSKFLMKSALTSPKFDSENYPVQDAYTSFEVVKQYEAFALVRAKIRTGRMHQIRFHLSQINHPLLGDPFYGGDLSYPRTMLHAERLIFVHPILGEEIIIHAGLPEDFKEILENAN